MSEDTVLYASPPLAAPPTKADDRQVGGMHYKTMPVQPWEVMESLLTHEEFVGFLKGNIIKYAMRTGQKAGSDDPAKLRHYQQKLAEVTKALIRQTDGG